MADPEATTLAARVRSDGGRSRRPVVRAGAVLGFGVGGLVDVIVFHLIFQHHHTVSGWVDPNAVDGLRTNLLADGLLAAGLLLVVLVGVALLYRSAERSDAALSRRAFVGATILGWGVFNVLDDLVNHRLLGAHHVVHGPDRFRWNTAFLLVSLVLIGFGWYLVRSDPGRNRRG